MPKHSLIRSDGFLLWIFSDPLQHPPPGRCPQDAMLRKVHPAEKIHAGGERLDEHFIRMKGKLELCFQKFRDLRQQFFQIFSFLAQNDKVIGVADITFRLQFPLHVMIEFVHVDIHEKLRGEISERQSDGILPFGRKAVDHLPEQPKDVRVFDMYCKNALQHCMVNAREEFPDVAF